jgi:hypothetical protein
MQWVSVRALHNLKLEAWSRRSRTATWHTGAVNKRLLPLFVALAPLTLAACGDDGPAATATEGDAFCKAAEVADKAGKDLDKAIQSADTKAVEDGFEKLLKAAKAAEAVAPTDIADVVKENNELIVEFNELFEDSDWDLLAVFEDEEFSELVEDSDKVDEDLEEYLDDKCGIEPDDTQPDESQPAETQPDDTGVTSGGLDAERFIELFAVGANVELTDEQKQCFIDETSELTEEDFAEAMSSTASNEVLQAIGLAAITCDIPVNG